jgi:hypothetical protein
MQRLTILSALLVGAIGCSQQTPDGTRPNAPNPTEASKLDALVLPEKPAKAITVKEALTRPEGDQVVVTGRVPGVKVKPYNAAVASVLLMTPEDLDDEAIRTELDCDDAAT